jgi:hypothetical protein
MNTTTRLSRLLLLGAAAVLITACSDDESSPARGDAATTNMDGGHDSSADTGMNAADTGASMPDTGHDAECMRADEAFQSFLTQHQNCEHDTDCAIIGDCSPNADFRSINASYADQGYELMQARCTATYDGPVYNPRCVEGRCDMQEDPHTCCGCPADGEDAGHEDDAGR